MAIGRFNLQHWTERDPVSAANFSLYEADGQVNSDPLYLRESSVRVLTNGKNSIRCTAAERSLARVLRWRRILSMKVLLGVVAAAD